MLIDWFTVIAQAINFLVLVWLLKRFLYQPILDAIDAREKQIAETLAEAAETKRAAEIQRDDFERKNQQFSDDRDNLVLEMKKEINVEREQLLETADQSAKEVGAKRMETMRRAEKMLADEITRRAQHEVFAISRKTLRDLADTSLEERITQAFLRQLRDVNNNTKQELADALTKSSEPVRVRSAFNLAEAERVAIRDAIKEISAADTPVHFEVAPSAIGGVELTSNGRKIAWSIDKYLTSLQKIINELTKPEEKTLEPKSEPESELVT